MRDPQVKSAARVLDVLQLFETTRRPMRAVEIGEALGVSQSSMAMVLRTMQDKGYLDLNPATRCYCPSARVAFLCQWVLALPHQASAIPNALRELAEQSGEAVLMGRLVGADMQYTAVLESRHALRFSPYPGTLRPVHKSALGVMLLSALDEAQVQRLLQQVPDAPLSARQAAEVQRQVSLARECGHHQSQGLSTPGASVIAVLLPTPVRGERWAVGIGAPVDRMLSKPAHLLGLLQAAAARC